MATLAQSAADRKRLDIGFIKSPGESGMAHFDAREWPTCLGLWILTGARSATGVLSKSSLL